jgi:hypothetical protein
MLYGQQLRPWFSLLLQPYPPKPHFANLLSCHCSCWVLGRYSKWLLEQADTGQRGELDSVMQGVCERCLDHNRRVQVWTARLAALLAAAHCCCPGSD